MIFFLVFLVCNFFAMESNTINTSTVKLILNEPSIDHTTKNLLLEKSFALTIGLLSIGEKNFDKEKFFPWTDEQKEIMTLLVKEGVNANPYIKYYDPMSGTVLFHLFLFGQDDCKNRTLFEKIDFMVNNLGVEINEKCQKKFDSIPISYAKEIIRERVALTSNDYLKKCSSLNEVKGAYNYGLLSLPGKDNIQEEYDINLKIIIDIFYKFGGDLSIYNKKNRNLLYYIIKGWQLSWDIDFLRDLIEFYKIPVITDNRGNTLLHAMARSPFFFFRIKDDLPSCSDFNRKWSLFSYICHYLSFDECNIKNYKGKLPHEITLDKYKDFFNSNEKLSHIIVYAHQKYFLKI